ncbi:MAG: lipase family protein [Pseudomonas sp.]|uniref:lipase family protein n=1 Tax=Pseudomonas sp. TaxID=306 RepID=UPI0030F0E1BB
MSSLSPKQAATVATHVYSAINMGESDKVFKAAQSMGLGTLFDFKNAQVSAGTSGAVLRKTTGFTYGVEGTGTRQGELLLAFRGTDITQDWLTDANCGVQQGPSAWMVHAGFNETFKSFREDLDRFMRGRKPTTIHCVGHSLGGALASLAADHISQSGVGGVKLYTFGAPRVGVAGFARNLTSKLGVENIHRVYHLADPVSMIPIFPFVHAPDDGPVCQLPWGSSFAFDAHKMENYLKSIGDASWTGLRRVQQTTLERDVQAWLKNSNGSVLMLSATSLMMISKAMQYLIAKAVGVAAGTVVTAGMTVLDQIAGLLISGANACKAIGDSLSSLIVQIFRFLGRPLPSAANLTVAFLRWVLELLSTTVINLARRAIDVGMRL